GGAEIANRYGEFRLRHQRRPPLIDQRNSAWCEPRRPDCLNAVGSFFIIETSRRDRQKFIVHDGEKVTGREAVCRRHNVRLSPSDKLPPDFESERTVVIYNAEPANLAKWPASLPILP